MRTKEEEATRVDDSQYAERSGTAASNEEVLTCKRCGATEPAYIPPDCGWLCRRCYYVSQAD